MVICDYSVFFIVQRAEGMVFRGRATSARGVPDAVFVSRVPEASYTFSAPIKTVLSGYGYFEGFQGGRLGELSTRSAIE